MKNSIELISRILLGHIFLLAGISKIGAGYTDTQGYMEAMGVPGMLLPVVIIVEIVGGLAVIIGFKTQCVAYVLAGFTALAAMLFHANLTDQMQLILFMKNWTICGGLLLLTVHGAGKYSLDKKLG